MNNLEPTDELVATGYGGVELTDRVQVADARPGMSLTPLRPVPFTVTHLTLLRADGTVRHRWPVRAQTLTDTDSWQPDLPQTVRLGIIPPWE